MTNVIKVSRSVTDSRGYGYIGGKLLPLVHLNEKGTLPEEILPVAKDLYPELRLTQEKVTDALEILCEDNFAKREFKPVRGGPPEKVCHYLLTSAGMAMLAMLPDQPGLTITVTD